MKNIFIPIFFMCFCVFSQTSNKSVLAKYTDDEIKIDGVLDETSWEAIAPATNFYQYFPTDTAQAKRQVEIKFMFSDINLYVGIKVYAKGKDYIIPSLRRDFRGGANDSVTLLFDTFNDGTNAFVFGSNPYGVRREILLSGGGNERQGFNSAWDTKWLGESVIHDDHYILEWKIPLSAFKYKEGERSNYLWVFCKELEENSIKQCSKIGDYGLEIIKSKIIQDKTFNILTHCNAGWLACVDWGTALAPIYKAYNAGLNIHVWVDETRPRSQGASLTAWELSKHGVPNTLIVDNAGGHLMQSGKVDMCIVGSDRTASNGDVCNKIGTYMKALCAFDNNIPFYVALPESTIDFSLESGVNKINIEERDNKEITHVSGINSSGVLTTVKIVTDMVSSHNPGFDVTPARLVTRLITDKGVCEASPEGIKSLFR